MQDSPPVRSSAWRAADVGRPPADAVLPATQTIALLALAAAVIWIAFFSGSGRLGLIGPDEPRYAAIAREMAESGDWITPRLHGQPWFEKPVLYYWGAGAAMWAFGSSEQSARLPSALAALLATLATAWLARETFGNAAALMTLVLVPTTIALMAFARAASTDMVFSGALALAFVAAARMGQRTSSASCSRAWPALWGLALGLAVLAKGPAALVLAGASVALWLLLTRQWHVVRWFLHPLALVVAGAVAAPWYVLCTLRNPEFFRIFFIEHNLQRYLTPVFQHEQPVWYFGLVLLAGFIPWTPLLLARSRVAWTANLTPAGRAVLLMAVCWAAVPFVFFSASQSKLPGYILPIFPPLALIGAVAIAQPTRWSAMALASPGLLMVMIAAGAAMAGDRLLPAFTRDALAPLGVTTIWPLALACAGVLIVALAFSGRRWASLSLTGATMATVFLGVIHLIVPALDPVLTARATAVAAQHASDTREIAILRLDRAWEYGLEYYLHRDLPTWTAGSPNDIVITSATGLRTLVAQGYALRELARLSDEAVVVEVRRATGYAGDMTPPGAR